MPVPSIVVQAPPLLTFPASSEVTLEARARVASCFASAALEQESVVTGILWSPIAFRWSHIASEGNVTPAPLALDVASSSRRSLRVLGSSLRSGVQYTLSVAGCMLADPAVCGTYQTDVRLHEVPLRASIAGGDRTLSARDALLLDACISHHDPEEPDAACAAGMCVESIAFAWSCAPMVMPTNQSQPREPPASEPPLVSSAMALEEGAAAGGGGACGLLAAPATSSCMWLIGGGVMPPGTYTFSVRVTSTRSGKAAHASVRIALENVALPTISIGSLVDLKQNPSSKLRLIGEVALPTSVSPPSDGARLELAWSVSPSEVTLALGNVTSTGDTAPRLVVLPNTLRPGGTYIFQLRATYGGHTASSTCQVAMNRAPFGGRLQVSLNPNPYP